MGRHFGTDRWLKAAGGSDCSNRALDQQTRAPIFLKWYSVEGQSTVKHLMIAQVYYRHRSERGRAGFLVPFAVEIKEAGPYLF
jgi:hypothetical protein